MEKILVLGASVILLFGMTLALSGAGTVNRLSISLCQKWKRNLNANYKKMTRKKFASFQRQLKFLRPIQIELGDCCRLDQQAIIPFYETVLDKIILLPKVFPSLKSVI